jgi:DNA-binding SARP family transcriptional activator
VVAAAAARDDERERLLTEAAHCASGPLLARVEELLAGRVDETSVFAAFFHGPATWESAALDGEVNRIEVMRGRAICRGEPVRLRGRELELLVALALANAPMSREALADRLWPDQDEHASSSSLRSTLHRLRAQTGPTPFVERDATQYRLAPGVTVDVTEAEALYHALRREHVEISTLQRQRLEQQFDALARGIPEAYARWSWFTPAAARLVDLRHGLGMVLARDDYAKERYRNAASWTNVLLDLDPLDEVAAELHFAALFRGAGRAEATRWLRRYRALLASEYGVEPSVELDRAAGERGVVT